MKVGTRLHPAEEVLERYSFGRLASGELEAVEEHLLVCEHCQHALETVERSIAEIKTACEPYRPRPLETRETFLARLAAFLTPARLAYAGAAAALFVAVGMPVFHNQSQRAPAVVSWDATYRGSDTDGTVQAGANRPLHFVMNLRDLPTTAAYRVDVVDQNGSTVWSAKPVRDGQQLVVDSPEGMKPGLYWVRLYGAETNPLREFGLRLD